jgi:predicted nucleic acid-binding protein
MLTIDANVWVAAFDPHDRFHAPSTAFLSAVTQQRVRLNGPAFVIVESACALARRAQDASIGETARKRLSTHPLLALHPVDDRLLDSAARMGARQLLRGADALYAATAEILSAQLVSWDDELVRRAGAVTPADWLAVNH